MSEALGDEDEKMNRRFGRVMALWANMNRPRGQAPKSEDDFIPKRPEKEKPKTKEEMSAQISSVFEMFM